MKPGETNEDGTRYMGEITAAQLHQAAAWAGVDFESPEKPVRLYALDDGSVDVHIGDELHTNIERDGTNNG